MFDRNSLVFIVMGVSGSGKTTVGKLLAQRIGARFVDADDYHSVENKSKMKDGIALSDADRLPWLEKLHKVIADAVAAKEKLVLACSALKRNYRQLLKGDLDAVEFVFLRVDQKVLTTRLQTRQDHFVDESLLPSQFEALEEPGADEALIVNADDDPVAIVENIARV